MRQWPHTRFSSPQNVTMTATFLMGFPTVITSQALQRTHWYCVPYTCVCSIFMDDVNTLREANRILTEQLDFSRQKASLYYIVSSELESLRNSQKVSFTVDVSTSMEIGSVSVSTQTDTTSQGVECDTLRHELEGLKTNFSSIERIETRRLSLVKALERLTSTPNDAEQLLCTEYSQLLEEYLRSCQLSINHSMEIKKRDEMISSLFDKIKLMEISFTRSAPKSAPPPQVSSEELTWKDMAAMHSELEDMRAELSKARSNWAATRDELLRLQFRVGIDGNHGQTVAEDLFPKPKTPQPPSYTPGLISTIRTLRPQ